MESNVNRVALASLGGRPASPPLRPLAGPSRITRGREGAAAKDDRGSGHQALHVAHGPSWTIATPSRPPTSRGGGDRPTPTRASWSRKASEAPAIAGVDPPERRPWLNGRRPPAGRAASARPARRSAPRPEVSARCSLGAEHIPQARTSGPAARPRSETFADPVDQDLSQALATAEETARDGDLRQHVEPLRATGSANARSRGPG